MTLDPETAMRDALATIAPEADLDDVAPDEDLADALDLDSMDFLNFLIALSKSTGVEIPESDSHLVRTPRDAATTCCGTRPRRPERADDVDDAFDPSRRRAHHGVVPASERADRARSGRSCSASRRGRGRARSLRS